MDIDQSKRKQETHTCYNCEEKGHLSHHFPKPWKQCIRLAEPNKVKIKGLIVEAVTAAMDARDTVKKAEGPKRVFRQVDGETHAPSTNRLSVLEMSIVGSTEDMLTPQLPVTTKPNQEPNKLCLNYPILIHSATLCRGTDILLQLSTIDSNTPMSIKALTDSGAMGLFIDIDYVQSNNLKT